MQHKLGTRLDEPAIRLMMVFPSVSHLGLRLAPGGTLLAHRLTGYVQRIYRYPYEGDLIEARSLIMRYARAVANAISEPFRFGIESTKPLSKHVAAFLTSCGLSMEEQRNFGPETVRNSNETIHQTC